tara:strand:- start:255 stop:638 length:384 start_codon:yes stop_codon:yes gene_type:complete
MMLQQVEDQEHLVPSEEIAIAQDQQEAVLLRLEEALALQEKAEQLIEATLPDAVLPQQEEAVVHQILEIIILQREDPLPLTGIIAAAHLEAHHLEVLDLEVLDLVKVHLHLKKEEIRKHYSQKKVIK